MPKKAVTYPQSLKQTFIVHTYMIGGGAESLNEFNADELFSTTRITVAPILIVLGYGIILFSVMKKSKNSAVKVSAISEDPKTEDKNPKKK